MDEAQRLMMIKSAWPSPRRPARLFWRSRQGRRRASGTVSTGIGKFAADRGQGGRRLEGLSVRAEQVPGGVAGRGGGRRGGAPSHWRTTFPARSRPVRPCRAWRTPPTSGRIPPPRRFYSQSEGLSFFGHGFRAALPARRKSAREWLHGRAWPSGRTARRKPTRSSGNGRIPSRS